MPDPPITNGERSPKVKWCPRCSTEKPLSDFYCEGKYGWCKPCSREYSRSRTTKQSKRAQHIKYKFGLTWDDYVSMIEAQGARCAICGHPDGRGGRDWAIDHDRSCCAGVRSCGRCVRGLLCMNCNRALGYFEDDIDRLRGAAEYLTKYRASR